MKAPSGLMIESALADFHALRQGFSPPAPSSITTLSSYDSWLYSCPDKFLTIPFANVIARSALVLCDEAILA